MKTFAEAWQDESILQAVAKLPWGHHVWLLELVKQPEERLWYVEQAIQNGWSRNVLVMQIDSDPNHNPIWLSSLQKTRINFDFLTLMKEAQERDLERAVLTHLRQFLIELGLGFAFV